MSALDTLRSNVKRMTDTPSETTIVSANGVAVTLGLSDDSLTESHAS